MGLQFWRERDGCGSVMNRKDETRVQVRVWWTTSSTAVRARRWWQVVQVLSEFLGVVSASCWRGRGRSTTV
ncbi:hypothetical protein DEO72_LG1g2034 [Vigna unguiculata]|uniref:Uncharacterized protein n=1 Tax=Vigna unguiculata TaxID=3917 RepID=A0A4D6KVA1_VIGUN|nr:hypothetical protein DEO72_LG1g2034 [Vigna unguiculata]